MLAKKEVFVRKKWHEEVLLAEVSIVEPYTFKKGTVSYRTRCPSLVFCFVLFLFLRFYYNLLHDLTALCHEQYSLHLQFTEKEFEVHTRAGHEH